MTTLSASAYSEISNSKEAAKELAGQIQVKMADPDVLIVFSSSKYDYQELLHALKDELQPRHLLGCSSAGEFVNGRKGEGAVSLLALKSDDILFNVIKGEGLSIDRDECAHQLSQGLQGVNKANYEYKTGLILADALAGFTDELIEFLNHRTGGTYQFFGGGAGDDGKFSKTHVFYGTEVLADSVVGLEILSHKPLGIGVKHGWLPTGELMRVTEAEGMKLVSLNSIPAAEVISEYAKKTNQALDLSAPISFFLHNTLAIKTKDGFKLRVPLSINEDGSVNCASNIPTGSLVSFMKATSASSIEAAEMAVESALKQLGKSKPNAGLFFDCVATRLRMGEEFALELASLEKNLGKEMALAGCNTYGQIARVNGQFNGFHNCTAVVCLFPE
jgi:hypothetical protein